MPARNQTKFAFRSPFAVPRDEELRFNPSQYLCEDRHSDSCQNHTLLFQQLVTQEFHRMINVFEAKLAEDTTGTLNNYNVSYAPSTTRNVKTSCLSELKVRTLRRKDLTGTSTAEQELRNVMPRRKLFSDNHSLRSCAVISSAGSLVNSKLGSFIDDHDLVMRFNHAPTAGHEEDVGTKTTVRIINSQVISKPEFDFLANPIFRNITIAAWDPGTYNATLSEWIQTPDYDMFTNYKRYMAEQPGANVHLIDPRSLWKLWENLQRHFPNKIRQNPPSSGFIGISLLVHHCEYIDVIEYVPSTRLTGRCHYYEQENNAMCTFGSWHPLAAEKLMVLDYNSADAFTTYQQGIVRIQPKSSAC